MRHLVFVLLASLLTATAHAQSCPVVDFGDNLFWYATGLPPYRAGTPDAKNPTRVKCAEGEFINGHPFSLDIPLSMVTADYNTKGNNTRFYGGMKTHCWDNPSNKSSWAEGGCNVDHDGYDDLNYMGYALESLNTPENPGCRQTAVGVWLWKKEDFLNDAALYPVTFDETSRLGVYLSRTYPVNQAQADRLIADGKIAKDARPFTDTYANQRTNVVPRDHWRGWESVHLLVQDGNQFYVAESGFEPAQQTLFEISPAKVQWTPYNPEPPWDFEFNHNDATFSPHIFSNVQAAGWMICKNTNENSALWCKWYGFGMDAVVNRPVEQQVGWNLPMKPAGNLLMAATEVSYQQWRRIWKWGQRNQFALHPSFAFDRDGNMGSMLADGMPHSQLEPVTGITWHDAVVWCNALSLYEGRTPCYYTDESCSNILRIARDGLSVEASLKAPVVYVQEAADGYRLPTLAEWTAGLAVDEPAATGIRTHPVGAASSNALGFCDMRGNVWEYIWNKPIARCDLNEDRAVTVVGGDYRESTASLLPWGEIPSRGHYAIGFRPVRRNRLAAHGEETTRQSPSNAPTWTFLFEEVIPPAHATNISIRPPMLEMTSVDGFEAGKSELTYAQWSRVFQWAELHGYRFSWDGDMGSMAWDSEPTLHTADEPVTCVGVLDAAVWCNAISEMSGFKPCYYLDQDRSTPLRIANPFRVISYQWTENGARYGGRSKPLPRFLFYIDKLADGYRLPMSEEWNRMYEVQRAEGKPSAWCAQNSQDRTHPVGTLETTNELFHDLSGNVFEWVISKSMNPGVNLGQNYDLEARGGSFRVDENSPSLGLSPSKGMWNWISTGWASPELGFRVVRARF